MKYNNDYNSRYTSYNLNGDFTRKKFLGLFWEDGAGVAFGGLLAISVILIIFLCGYNITLLAFAIGVIPLVFSIMLLKFGRSAKGNRPYIPATITAWIGLVIILTTTIIKIISLFEIEIVRQFVLDVAFWVGVMVGMILVDVWIAGFPMYKLRTEKRIHFVFLDAKIVEIEKLESIYRSNGVDKKRISYAPVYEYEFNGKTYKSVNSYYASVISDKVGDICTVKIDPEKPAKVNPIPFRKLSWVFMMLFGFSSFSWILVPLSSLWRVISEYLAS